MFRNKPILILFLLVTTINTASGYVFITGNHYQKLSTYEKEIYLTGVLDGSTSMLWGVGKLETREWLIKCTESKPLTQLMAIFDKYLKNNPENWHNTASSSFHWAIREACPMEGDK